MFGDAFPLSLGSDHEARDVLEEHQRDTPLCAKLNEVSALLGGAGEKDTVVGDDADLVAVDGGEARDERGAEVTLELGEVAAVDDAADDGADGKGFAEVGSCDAEELLWVVQGLLVGLDGGGGLVGGPVEVGDGTTGEGDGVGVIDSQVICHTRHGGVHLTTSEVFGRHDLSRGSLDQRRSRKEDVALLVDDDGLIRHGGDVGSSSGAGAHDHGDLGDALGGHAGLVVEDAAEVVAVGEDIGLVGEVGAAGVDHVDAAVASLVLDLGHVFQIRVSLREIVLLRNGLCAEMLLHGDGVVRSSLDSAIVRNNHARHTLNHTNTRDNTTSRHFSLRVQLISSHRTQFKERRARIDQCRHTIAGQHLIPLQVLLPRLLRPALLNLGREVLHLVHERRHGAVVLEILR